MRVAVVFSGLRPDVGGGHTFQRALLEALRRVAPDSRHDLTLYATGVADTWGPDVVSIPAGRWARAGQRALRTLRGTLDRADAPRLGPRTFLERSLAERGIELVWFASHHVEECGQPFVCTVWDLAHLVTPWFPEVGADGEWQRRQRQFDRALPRATCVIVPNRALTEVVERAYGVSGDRVLELPFPTPGFALDPPPAERDGALLERHGIAAPYLLYPAQFWPHKNHRNALEALARLDVGLELVLVGTDKGALGHVRALARRLGVEERTRFLGFVSTDELVALYRRAHALLYLSFLGPANLPPLEAQALGCPVVCADVPGMREQLGEGARFAPPTDPDAIAACVRSLDDPDERARLAAAGAERAASSTADGYVRAVLDWIDDFEPIRACWD